MKRVLVVAASGLATLGPAVAARASAGFSGSCQFSGPITPMPPITLVPESGARFSYQGAGTCTGGAPITVAFNDVGTVFDTCELGPDFGLHGTMAIGSQPFDITVNLPRLAVAGPFTLTTSDGGLASGVASFSTPSPTDCISSGVASATLSGSFQTLTPLG